MDSSEIISPSMATLYGVIRRVFSKPYWLELSLHHIGVNFPRVSEKFPGQVHVPISLPLMAKEMSDGQLLLEYGNSEESSIDNSNSANCWFSVKGLGIRYSTNPFESQIILASMRRESINTLGSSSPMTEWAVARPHVGCASKSVYMPTGRDTSFTK